MLACVPLVDKDKPEAGIRNWSASSHFTSEKGFTHFHSAPLSPSFYPIAQWSLNCFGEQLSILGSIVWHKVSLFHLPRDIVVKPYFYRVKEEVMRLSRNADHLTIQCQPVQVFADLSTAAIQKWPALKPLLLSLSQKTIKYWWSFPFHLNLIFQHKTYGFSSFSDAECSLLKLDLISQDPIAFSHRGSSSSKRPSSSSPLTSMWQ